jgi:hypothetical protein
MILCFWRMALHSNKLVTERPRAVQCAIVASYCLIAMLLFLSYEMLTLTTRVDVSQLKPEEGSKRETSAKEIENNSRENWTGFWRLLFVLEFNLLATWENTTFSLSWAFVFLRRLADVPHNRQICEQLAHIPQKSPLRLR